MTLSAVRLRPTETRPVLTVEDLLPPEARVLADAIVPAAAAFWKVTVDEILSHRRPQHLVVPRAFVVWALRNVDQPFSYPAIAELLGGRNHTTVINLHEKAEYLRRRYVRFRTACELITATYTAEKAQWLQLMATHSAASHLRLVAAFIPNEETSNGDARH